MIKIAESTGYRYHHMLNKVHPTTEIPYSLILSKRKSISLIVHPEKGLIVRAPLRTRLKLINELISKKEQWVRRKLRHYETTIQMPIDPWKATQLPLLGRKLSIKRYNKSLGRIQIKFGDTIQIIHGGHSTKQMENAIVRSYRKYSDEYLINRVEVILSRLKKQGLMKEPREIKTREFKRRWGSLSQDGVLKLNWRLILATPDIINYVIIHELAHLYHFNHSKKYWHLVSKLNPQYREHRKWLKLFGHTLVLRFKN